MVENDRRLGEAAGQVGQLVELRMEQPRIEREAEGRKPRKSLAEASVGHQTRRSRAQRVHQAAVRIPDDDVANAPEAAAAGPNVSLEHLLHLGAPAKISVSDDPGTDARWAVSPARRRRRYAVDELGFAHWTKRRIAIGAIHRLPLHENGGGYVVATRFD